MPNALITGVSGLITHQRMLDVVGHNIANVNTTGYKSQRTVFADLMYQTLRPASGGGNGLGGMNPNQIGGGVRLQATDRNMGQGSLESTGGQFDVAISGDGFFVVTDGEQDFYTRAGTFSLDANKILVGQDGLTVKREGSAGEADATTPGFQIPGDDQIRVPIGATIPGTITSEVEVAGNLDSNATGDQELILQSATTFKTDPSTDALATTLLNDLVTNTVDYGAGDSILLTGRNADGTSITPVSVAVTGATTLQDVVDAINANFTGFTASFSSGHIILTGDSVGPSEFAVTISDESASVGRTTWATNALSTETQEGKFADTFNREVTVYDSRGGAHEMSMLFTKVSDDVWTMTASIDPSEGTVPDDTISAITFNDDGTLSGTTDAILSLQINGIAAPQMIEISFQGAEDSLTHFALDSNMDDISQDGAGPGTLLTANIDANGLVKGIATNGKVFTIAQLAVATMSNPAGLEAIGGNLFVQSLNSGEPQIGLAGTGNRGSISAGTLEASNVDIALEFSRLIVAQRGFVSNARTITVADEVLEELTNMVR